MSKHLIIPGRLIRPGETLPKKDYFRTDRPALLRYFRSQVQKYLPGTRVRPDIPLYTTYQDGAERFIGRGVRIVHDDVTVGYGSTEYKAWKSAYFAIYNANFRSIQLHDPYPLHDKRKAPR